jgi:protein SEY1
VQVNLKLFQSSTSHKTVLLMVIRDRTRTPYERMCQDLRKDLDSIWASLVKPPELADASLDHFFELKFVSLPSYELQQDVFVQEATALRERFHPSSTDAIFASDESKVCIVREL